MNSGKSLILLLFIFITSALTLTTGCGVIIDYANDNELYWGALVAPRFVSPVKLRVAVAPFVDEVGLGAPEAGANLARLLSEELAKSSELDLVPLEEVKAALNTMDISGQITPEKAAQIGSTLRLNALVIGSVSEVKKYNQRKGWRRLARFFTSQREYVDAVLAISAIDITTGIILVSRANTGEYNSGPSEKGFFDKGEKGEFLSQEAMEGSLNEALVESYHRTLNGLAALPFKARVISTGDRATISFGRDVGIKPGLEFVRLEVLRTLTNTIGESYQIMGAAVAHLKVVEVDDHSASLEIMDGQVYPDDIIQAIN
ncbi:MAG: hypothetical protein LBV77_02130 [Candidatus Adiutrix intracellularis]|jgi:hypothetical protein|nr:hypothetical protein [Candidatus Adiutrix intracellularis]